MTERRPGQVWALIEAQARADDAPPSLQHAGMACRHAVDAAGVGVSMVRGPGLHEPIFATDPPSEELAELQYTLGEGPSLDVASTDRPVLMSDLTSLDAVRRWPMFAPAATELGFRGMFAFPIAAGAARVGVLDVYRFLAGPMTGGQLADALAFADAMFLLALDARGGLVPNVGYGENVDLTGRRAEVHQAAGMVSVQLGVHVTEALARLRAHSYLHDQRLGDLAGDVVTRRLRFQPDPPAANGIGRDRGGTTKDDPSNDDLDPE